MNRHAKVAGVAAFVWRLVLTSGTGAIFAFLVARPGYGSAILPPLFIVLSFAWGLAVFLLAEAAAAVRTGNAVSPELAQRMRRLLALFVVAALYLVVMHHLTTAYFARQAAFERFALLTGGIYPLLLWAGYGLVGTALPLALLWHPRFATPRATLVAAALVLAGAFAFLYAFIIGGQAYPLDLLPGHTVRGALGDGEVAPYMPSLPEAALGLGGVAVAFLVTLAGVHLLPVAPRDGPA